MSRIPISILPAAASAQWDPPDYPDGVTSDPIAHWDAAYAQGDTTRSWYQGEAATSAALLSAAGVTPEAAVIDVGGGASTLVDGLLTAGFTALTVLDISPLSLDLAQQRLGPARAGQVTWVVADILAWTPDRTYDVWHDRAVLHFMTTEHDRVRYRRALVAATAPGSVAIFGVFGPQGPEACSGLATRRYDADDIADFLGSDFHVEATELHTHHTPAGADQQFLWARAVRR